ncbi:hypothetical protein [Streptomyces luteogriseus]
MATPAKPQSRACPSCNGAAGHVETTTTDDGVMRQTWRSCTACHGSGRA